MKKIAYLLFSTFLGTSTLSAATYLQTGTATYYGKGFYHRKTASGERYSKDSLTAAHRSLPFGSLVRVTAIKSKRSVIVRINDRGPRSRRKIIDLSVAAARQLNILRAGVAKVRVELIKSGNTVSRHQRLKKQKAEPVKEKTETVVAAAPATEKAPSVYGVQTGAFRDHSNALHALEVLNANGYSKTGMDMIHFHEARLYRVYIGPFSDMAEADDIMRRLREQKMEAYVVPVSGTPEGK